MRRYGRYTRGRATIIIATGLTSILEATNQATKQPNERVRVSWRANVRWRARAPALANLGWRTTERALRLWLVARTRITLTHGLHGTLGVGRHRQGSELEGRAGEGACSIYTNERASDEHGPASKRLCTLTLTHTQPLERYRWVGDRWEIDMSLGFGRWCGSMGSSGEQRL